MRFREVIGHRLKDALHRCGYVTDDVPLVLERPRLKEHGDIATPIALSLAKVLKKSPMEIAERVARELDFAQDEVSKIEVAKPGYLNLRVAHDQLLRNVRECRVEGDAYGATDIGKGARCQIEYVSANPTGPLVVVSARAAAVGSVIVNLLRSIGFAAEGEYYVNDCGNQVQALGKSLRFRLRERLGHLGAGEEIGAYPGDYLKAVAARVTASQAAGWDADNGTATAGYGDFATEHLLAVIKEDLRLFGVKFDNFFRESTLHPHTVEEARRIIEDNGHAYSDSGALYFRTTTFGDEKDRVLVKSDGNPTYFLGDIAYHLDKYRRGYKWVVDILGPDHHGHIPRMQAASSVLAGDKNWLKTLIVGWVRLLEGDRPLSMSKRSGEIITMRELIEDVGADVAKYLFLMRRSNTPLDFDLELARKQSDENPVYYVQYAHARIANVIRFAKTKLQKKQIESIDLSRLDSPEERDLMVQLLFFPSEVEAAALSFEPHRLTTYARELATLFHRFYHEHRIVTDDQEMSNARLYLVEATKQVLSNVLRLTGVDAPNSM
ncbi:MAG: arginine--tRNA ligase [Candidatus Krumholzibacteria bacterium]|nr:arginine--tRNA ligase [Candidatus Krumholzibacteria bacterium]